MVVCNQVKSIRKDGIAQKFIFKTKGPYKVQEKATPISYLLRSFHFCEGLGGPGRKVEESVAMMGNIPSTMVLHNNLDGADTRFSTIT